MDSYIGVHGWPNEIWIRRTEHSKEYTHKIYSRFTYYHLTKGGFTMDMAAAEELDGKLVVDMTGKYSRGYP